MRLRRLTHTIDRSPVSTHVRSFLVVRHVVGHVGIRRRALVINMLIRPQFSRVKVALVATLNRHHQEPNTGNTLDLNMLSPLLRFNFKF